MSAPWHQLLPGGVSSHTRASAILVARFRIIDGLDDMGAKYLPSKKDLKANQRFIQKQLLPKSAFKKASAVQPPITKTLKKTEKP